MASSRRFITLGVAAIVALTMGLTACGSNGKSNGDTTQQADSNNTNTVQEQQGAQDQKKEETSKESQVETRVVKDEFGDVTIPANPKRIAGIYVEDYLVALGITPIVQWYHPSWGKQDYLNLDVPTFDITGNLEAILEASPDLIIVDGAVDKEKYELYSKIAPTYRLPEGAPLDRQPNRCLSAYICSRDLFVRWTGIWLYRTGVVQGLGPQSISSRKTISQ